MRASRLRPSLFPSFSPKTTLIRRKNEEQVFIASAEDDVGFDKDEIFCFVLFLSRSRGDVCFVLFFSFFSPTSLLLEAR